MKKVINITIGGLIFFVEEDAYNTLLTYLERIKQHFASFPDSSEIIQDMEARIAEHFEEEKIGTQSKVITADDVNKLIKTMGQIEDFAESDDHTTAQNGGHKIPKKLFRNPDDQMLGGVASGLAAYFGIDPVIIRILFVVLSFAGGLPIVIYIILWIVLPEANTPTEQMQMKGDPITVAKVEETIKQKAHDAKKHSGTQKVIRLPALVIGAIGKFMNKFLRILGRFTGAIITISAAIGVLGALVLFVTLLFNRYSPYVDFPLQTVLSSLEYYVVVTLLFLLTFIPVLFLLLFGKTLLTLKNAFHKVLTISLLGVWIGAVAASSALAFNITPKYRQAMENDPRNQHITKTFDVRDFTGIDAGGGHHVRITKGDSFHVRASGRQIDIDRLELSTNNNVLDISYKGGNFNNFKICIFCDVFSKETTIEIQMPELTRIDAHGAVIINASGFTSDSMNATLSGASEITLDHNARETQVRLSGASEMQLSGGTDNLRVRISGASDLHAENMSANRVTVEASGASQAAVRGIETVYVDASGASSIYIHGNPTITTDLSGASSVYSETERFIESQKRNEEPREPIEPVEPDSRER